MLTVILMKTGTVMVAGVTMGMSAMTGDGIRVGTRKKPGRGSDEILILNA
jgi:hypothetical protein